MAPNYTLRRAVVLAGLAGTVWAVHSGVTAVAGIVAPRAVTPAVAPPAAPPEAATPAGPAPAQPAAAVPPPAPAKPAPPREKITGTDPVTLSFAGDTHFAKQLSGAATDPEGLAALKPHLSGADITILNLETAITAAGRPMGGKEFTFAAPASALTTLANAGVDVVSMANNHAVDFGADGLSETLAARATSPVRIAGIGANEDDAFAPAVITVDGVSVAVLAATQLKEHTTTYFTARGDKPGVASMVNPERLLRAVREASEAYDVVVVVPHWGQEKELCPTPLQAKAAQELADAGADAVVGSHSHRVMGSGWKGATYVGYGLGNFVWFLNTTFPGRSTGVLTIEVDKKRVAAQRDGRPRAEIGPVVTGEAWTPLLIPTSGIPVADPETADAMRADRAKVQSCSKLDAQPPGAAPTAPAPAAAPAPSAPAPGAASAEPSDVPFEVKGIPVVSRSHPLSKAYVPAWSTDRDGLHPDVRAAVDAMIADAKAARLPLQVRSGYRSWAVQNSSFKRAYASYGEGARRYYAEAGHSEHQIGLALDLAAASNQPGHKFAQTPQAGWVAENAAKYGFIIRYPEGKRDITGVDHEPWHVRWVGVEVAAEMAKRPGVTLEEFLGLA